MRMTGLTSLEIYRAEPMKRDTIIPAHYSHLPSTSQSLLEALMTKTHGGSLHCHFMLNLWKVNMKYVIFPH